MADLAILTPTRGRPDRFAAMCKAALELADGSVQIWAGIDDDDPSDYVAAMGAAGVDEASEIIGTRGHRRSLSAWTNYLAKMALGQPGLRGTPPRYLASLGDDHMPRTRGWDRALILAIESRRKPGFAYGNDLFQGARVPTAWVQSAEIAQALGWVMLPTCAHMYVDNAVLSLGQALDAITYRPDIIIEHVHYLTGKAAHDATYASSNTEQRYAADREAYELWRRDRLAEDVATVREAAAQLAQVDESG